jgi:photosystem II stability/assembly factor-like uncharacterized protein
MVRSSQRPAQTPGRLAYEPESLFSVLMLTTTLGIAGAVGAADAAAGPSGPPTIVVKVVANGESAAGPEDCRGTLVGPGVNQLDPFPGYRGFVGWESPVRLRNGSWLVGFNAGYWHFSPPTPFAHEAEAKMYGERGMPLDISAPRGGRAMLIRSADAGVSWGKPETLVDTAWDDSHPSFLELPSGTLLCSLFVCNLDGVHRGFHSMTTRSADGGRTWEEPQRVSSHFLADETDGPMVLARDGSVYLVMDGVHEGSDTWEVGVFRSTDEGQSWELLSVVKADHSLYEPSIAELPDGTLVLITRPEGELAFSKDHGRTWSTPVSFGMRLYAPSLEVLPDGTLVCIHGSYGAGGLRVIFSRDGGQTWIAPDPKYGFLIDHSYGYGKAMRVADGTLFLTYLSTPGIAPRDAASNSIWCIRMRIRPDGSGIDLLAAPNRL